MSDIERCLSPLFRPPLGLAVTGAALKCVATMAILADPLLRHTRGDFLREREDNCWRKSLQRLALLAGRGLFIGLAACCFEQDVVVLSEGFRHLSGFQRVHLVAMVLAFSPNTVAAVAAAGILEMKAAWLKGLPMNRCVCGSLADAAALAYVAFMTAVYLLPLAAVSVLYGVPGLLAIAWSFMCEMLVRPWELVTQHKLDLSGFWVALPIMLAFVLGNCLIVVIVYCTVRMLEWRYPQIAQQVRGQKGKGAKSGFAGEIPCSVIGLARDLAGWSRDASDVIGDASGSKELELLEAEAGEDEPADNPQAASSGLWGVAAREEDRCLLNDPMLGAIWLLRVVACVALPLLQVCVAIFARMLLGQAGPWAATQEVFGERTWAKYTSHIQSAGSSGVLPLLWYYT